MKLAILNLTGGGISGGHKKYLLNMLPRLAASGDIKGILCASPAGIDVETWLPGLPGVSYFVCEPFRPLRHSPDGRLSAALDSFGPDVLFVPVERYINYKDLPVVVMLQNMAPLAGVKTGAGFKERLVAIARRRETKIALERSATVIVPTEYVKNFLAGQAGLPAEKITVVHYGHNPAPASARRPGSFPFSGNEFVFTAGSLEAYRGIEDLLRALPGLKLKRPGIKLAVAGGYRPATEKYFSRLKVLAADLQVAGDVAWLGDLPGEELSWCYSNCAVFALTSRMESFCFVALEALTHGCSIVSTDSACLPEILGEAAVYYKAGDASALELALENVLGRPAEVRKKFSETAARAGSGFLWDETAEKTLNVLKRALGPV